MKTIRIGTRSSILALWQAHWVRDELVRNGVSVDVVPISTTGDHDQNNPLTNMGFQGVFAKEIQRALLDHRVDLAVHSLKDLPVIPVDGLQLSAVPERADTRDAFLSRKYQSLDALPDGAVIGTGSLRRQNQIFHYCKKQLEIRPIRGNVETRIKKMEAGEYDAIILASAGLTRLGFTDQIRHYLEPPCYLPAVGQGALGLETRCDDQETIEQLMVVNHPETFLTILAERSLLRTLEGGCIVPIGALGRVRRSVENNNDGQKENAVKQQVLLSHSVEKRGGPTLHLMAQIFSMDGKQCFQSESECSLETELMSQKNQVCAKELGRDLAEGLLKQGAAGIIDDIKKSRK